MAEDYYKVLGVERTATPEEIKRAYRRLAHQYHPDRDGGDEEKFKEVNAAYQVLGDQNKRAQYDQFGQAFDGAGGNPFAGFDFGSMGDLGGLGDIFAEFFGGGVRQRARRGVRRGRDIVLDVTISFQESAQGVKREISPRIYQTCTYCRGSGAEPGTPIRDCEQCQGTGQVNQTQRTPFGVFTRRSICSACQGEGKKPQTLCTTCRGEGRQLGDKNLVVDIPAGISDGQTIRLSGQGEVPVRGGVAGDIYINVHVKPDKHLTRDGDDVRSTIDISFADAALGTTVTTYTLAGDKAVSVPPGTQPGQTITLPGLGFTRLNGSGRGDHIITVRVQIPRRLSRQQRKILEDFRSQKKRRFF